MIGRAWQARVAGDGSSGEGGLSICRPDSDERSMRAYACSMACRFALRGLPCPARPCPLPRTNLLRPGQSLPDPAQAPSLHTTSTPKLTVKYQPVRNIPCLPLGNDRGPPDPCPPPHRCPTAARPPRRARPRAWAGPRARSKHAGVDADARRVERRECKKETRRTDVTDAALCASLASHAENAAAGAASVEHVTLSARWTRVVLSRPNRRPSSISLPRDLCEYSHSLGTSPADRPRHAFDNRAPRGAHAPGSVHPEPSHKSLTSLLSPPQIRPPCVSPVPAPRPSADLRSPSGPVPSLPRPPRTSPPAAPASPARRLMCAVSRASPRSPTDAPTLPIFIVERDAPRMASGREAPPPDRGIGVPPPAR